MKIFRRIFNRFGWKKVLLVYLLIGTVLYVLNELCMLTVPFDQRHLGWFERPLGCKGFELVISLIRAFLYFPSTFIVPELLFRFDNFVGATLTQSKLVMFLTPVIANAFFLFLLGGGLDHLRGRKREG